MNDELLYERLLKGEIAINFVGLDSFKVFCAFLRTKGIHHKNDSAYYWEKYGDSLCVTISESGNFKCGSRGNYKEKGREIFVYEKNPYIVELVDMDGLSL